jgi:hypothetical protein
VRSDSPLARLTRSIFQSKVRASGPNGDELERSAVRAAFGSLGNVCQVSAAPIQAVSSARSTEISPRDCASDLAAAIARPGEMS